MLHLHRLEGEQALALGNLVALRNLHRGNPPRHRRLDFAVVDAVRCTAAARAAREVVSLALVEDDDTLIIRKTRNLGNLLFAAKVDRLTRKRDRQPERRIEPKTRDSGKRNSLLAGENRYRRRGTPHGVIGRRVGDQLAKMFLYEARVDLGVAKIGFDQRIEQEGRVGSHRPDFDTVKHCNDLGDCSVTVCAGADQLGDHRIVEGRDRIPFLDTGFDASVFPKVEMLECTNTRQKPVGRVLGVQPRLDGVAGERQFVLRLRKLLA